MVDRKRFEDDGDQDMNLENVQEHGNWELGAIPSQRQGAEKQDQETDADDSDDQDPHWNAADTTQLSIAELNCEETNMEEYT